MAKRGAPQGNQNAAKGKRWQDALVKALAQYENKEGKIKRGQALAKVAEMVVMRALVGDKDAWKEIGDRLDGKAAQSLEVTGDPDNPVENRIEYHIVDHRPK